MNIIRYFIHKSVVKILFPMLVGIMLTSCELIFMEPYKDSDPELVFESLWENVNNKYAFFDYKQIDWDEQYTIFKPRISNNMSDEALFEVLFEMLGTLRDAHVNLWSPFNVSRYELVFLNSPENFDFRLLQDNYLGTDYYTSGSLINQFLNKQQIGYIFYGSFINYVSDTAIDFVVNRFRNTRGIIIDVRNNGGGDPTNAKTILGRFTLSNREALLSYIKSGIGPNDFDGPDKLWIRPKGDYQYVKPVVILTNRGSYSATNLFAASAKALPNAVLIGDTTGGGGGIPAYAELPNGWGYRFSASQTYMPDGFNIEDGVPPDIAVNMNMGDIALGIDTILETAINYILTHN